jgi:D-glycero-alpha-D-manno-heptose-7-phosphate kinase
VRVTSSAPTRIDLAGGTIDIWPLYLFHEGALTLNAAISLRARCRIDPLPEGRIVLESRDAGGRIEAAGWSALGPDGDLRLLARLVRHFRAGGLELLTESASPVGAGIAGSSAMNIAVAGALARWTRCDLGDQALLDLALNIEAQVIEVPTGVQDYRPALYGGVSAVELGAEGVRRVALAVDPDDLGRRLVLAYTGASRNSGINNWDVTRRHIDGDRRVFDHFEQIRDIAIAMREALERHDWPDVGRQIDAEWANRKALAPGVSTEAIESLLASARRAGALAGKVCGAGGGGCLFCLVDPADRPAVAEALTGGGAEVLEFEIDRRGLVVEAVE